LARLGKLASLVGSEDVRDWIASAIQTQAAKENAGLVEITRFDQSSRERHFGIVLKTVSGGIQHTIWIKTERVASIEPGNAREQRI
jgi:hypothetical protein